MFNISDTLLLIGLDEVPVRLASAEQMVMDNDSFMWRSDDWSVHFHVHGFASASAPWAYISPCPHCGVGNSWRLQGLGYRETPRRKNAQDRFSALAGL